MKIVYSFLFLKHILQKVECFWGEKDYILKKIIAGYLGTDQGLFFDLQKMMKYAQKISDFTPLTVHDFEEIRKMSDPYYLGRLTKMNNRLLETIEANKKKIIPEALVISEKIANATKNQGRRLNARFLPT